MVNEMIELKQSESTQFCLDANSKKQPPKDKNKKQPNNFETRNLNINQMTQRNCTDCPRPNGDMVLSKQTD